MRVRIGATLRMATVIHCLTTVSALSSSASRVVMSTFVLRREGAHSESTTKCFEMSLLQEEIGKPDSDDVENWFPTSYRHFNFGEAASASQETGKLISIRTTSFGCGKHGYQVWPTSIALSLYLLSSPEYVEGKRVLELGSGCGLPSVFCSNVLSAASVLATDFWAEKDDEFDSFRLVPHALHGENLKFNMEKCTSKAGISRLDWHKPDTVDCARSFHAEVIVGSDLIYYQTDVEPLWKTIAILMEGERGASDVVLFSPLQPEVREALPTFMSYVRQQAESTGLVFETNELTMHKGDVEGNRETFLQMNISKR